MADTCEAPTLLRDWRTKKEHSQGFCAKKVGVQQSTWCEWEKGRRQPHIAQALAIATLTDGAVPVESWVRTKRRSRSAA